MALGQNWGCPESFTALHAWTRVCPAFQSLHTRAATSPSSLSRTAWNSLQHITTLCSTLQLCTRPREMTLVPYSYYVYIGLDPQGHYHGYKVFHPRSAIFLQFYVCIRHPMGIQSGSHHSLLLYFSLTITLRRCDWPRASNKSSKFLWQSGDPNVVSQILAWHSKTCWVWWETVLYGWK